MEALAGWLPADLAPAAGLALVGLSILTSAITAAFGIGGGMVLLAGLGFFLPVPALVPIHGLVQVGSNGGRALLLARSVDGRSLAWFLPGAAVGALLGGLVVVDLPAPVLRGAVGLFVLVTAWRKPRLAGSGAGPSLAIGGAFSSVLSMFVGATGPFVVALMRRTGLDPEPLVATNAVAMFAQHGLKVVAFGYLGFALTPWIPFVLAMVAGGFLGTLFGARLLRRLPKAVFARGLRVILSIAGIGLVVGALSSL